MSYIFHFLKEQQRLGQAKTMAQSWLTYKGRELSQAGGNLQSVTVVLQSQSDDLISTHAILSLKSKKQTNPAQTEKATAEQSNKADTRSTPNSP